MKKLPGALIFVTLALVVLNIVVLRELSRVEERLLNLERKTAATSTAGK